MTIITNLTFYNFSNYSKNSNNSNLTIYLLTNFSNINIDNEITNKNNPSVTIILSLVLFSLMLSVIAWGICCVWEKDTRIERNDSDISYSF